MVNANWLLLIWGTITIMVVGMLFIPMIFPEAEGINPIKGYVSEAKKKAQAEAEAEKKAQEEPTKTEKLYTPPQPSSTKFSKIIGIQLSRTCIQMEKFNLSSNCPTYKDLLQFDNTMKSVSGDFTNDTGVWSREKSNYKNHCNFYIPAGFPLLIVVDPDGCWQRERGIKMVFIHAITPEKMVFKLTADKTIVQNVRDLNKDERLQYANKQDSEGMIDRLEDRIDSQKITVNNLEDSLDNKNLSSLQIRNINFQIQFARDALGKMQTDLNAEEIKLAIYTRDLKETRLDLQAAKIGTSSRLMIDGTTSFGVGRYVDECHNASIGADMHLITDTINYLITNCGQTDFVSIKTTYVDPTPINIMDHTFYKYKAWLKKAIEECKVKC